MVEALALVKSLGHEESLLPVLHGLWVNAMTAGELEESMRWAEQMIDTATERQDEALLLSGLRVAMTFNSWLGHLVEAREYGDRLRQVYDLERHWEIADRTNSDPLTGDGIYRGQTLWMLGFPDQSVELTLANHTRL